MRISIVTCISILLAYLGATPASAHLTTKPSDDAAAPAARSSDLDPSQQAELQALYGSINPPPEETFPVPPDGRYTLELGGDTVDVFRDEYGVPYISAPSVEAAFRAQAYVLMEDRAIQILHSRQAVLGLLSLTEGPKRLGLDTDVRRRAYTDAELQGMVDALRPDQLRYLQAYLAGVNDYLSRYAPQVRPARLLDMAAGAVYYLAWLGDFGGDEFDIYQLLRTLTTFKGEQFAWDMLNDCMPLDVPNAPTTDHTQQPVGASGMPEPGQGVQNNVPKTPRPGIARDLSALARYRQQMAEARAIAQEDGVYTRWGSFAWLVRPERSQTGHAMLFGAPYLHFDVPPQGALMHLKAPGFQATGMCFHGTPGIMVGHNERLAWMTTCGLMNVTDIFAETVDPANPHRYLYKGAWKEMELYDSPIPVRNDDGTFRLEPLTVYRTVHGPVVVDDGQHGRAYTRNTSYRHRELESYLAFLDINFARNMEDVEAASRTISTTHNVFAADVDGNIGYWLTGRFPVRNPKFDPRLPMPGTGEGDWQGFTCLTDLVSSLNPPQGWLANWNNKPSTKTPNWFPEGVWGIRIFQIIGQENPISWERFWQVNQQNGENNFIATYLKPYLLRLLKEPDERLVRDIGDEARRAVAILEQWPNNNVPGAPGALVFNEWFMETMVRIFRPDFGPIVERRMDLWGLKLFGGLTLRLLRPDMAGIPVNGDYLHGRDKDELAYQAFHDIIQALLAKHGPDMDLWPFNPKMIKVGDVGEIPDRNCGTYWMAVDLGDGQRDPIRGVYLLCPGQSERTQSPHRADQFEQFRTWQSIEMKSAPG